jgi:hypothetical protein
MTERQRRIIRRVMINAVGDAMGEVDVSKFTDIKSPDTTDDTKVAIKITPELGDAMFGLRDASIVAGLVEWSLEQPLPTLDTVQDLPGALYDALAEATSTLSAGLTLDTSPSPDPASPTPPSSASNGPLRDAVTPTITLSNSGASTSIENSSI